MRQMQLPHPNAASPHHLCAPAPDQACEQAQRALSRLSEMGSQEWVERGMGLEHKGGRGEKEGWQRVRSRWREDSM